jgi:hypothetical protein
LLVRMRDVPLKLNDARSGCVAEYTVGLGKTQVSARFIKTGSRSKAAKKFVEFVCGVEVGFEFARAEFIAEIVETAGKKVERGRKHFFVGENDVAPSGVGAACEAK